MRTANPNPSAACAARFALLALLLAAPLALAGCVSFGRHVEFPPHQETQTAGDSSAFPGLTARATLNGTGDRLTIVAFVQNAGNVTYRVETGCGTPWDDQLFDGDEVLPLRQPVLRCAALSFASLPPGLSTTNSFSWNGTVWDADDERYEPVPRGDYVWSVRFVAYAPENSTGPAFKRFELDFDVTVG